MTQNLHPAPEVIDRLSQLVGASTLPKPAHDSCVALIERLKSPVQIGLMGLPGAGKRMMLNALVGTQVVPEDQPVPTLEVVGGSSDQISAILSDGAHLSGAGHNMQDMLAQWPVFLSLTSRACAQTNLEYLMVVTDKSPKDMNAALRWASERIDIAVWCTQRWSQLEADSWANAPERLQDHALLCVLDPQARLPSGVPGFESVLQLGPDPHAAARQVSIRLEKLITDAIGQDLLSAEYFLERYAQAKAPAPAPAPAAPVQVQPEDTAAPDAPPEALAELGRYFRQIRRAAAKLRHELHAQALDDGALTDAIGTTLEDLVQQADDCEVIHETWPHLNDALIQARDLVVLMRMENGPAQATDAVRIMLQLRGDMEMQLAA